VDATKSTVRVTSEELIEALADARKLEIELLEGIDDSQLLGKKAHFLEPPIWEFGHVGWFQEYWILRLRWDHAYPSRRETHAYLTEVLNRSIGRIESREPSAQDAYFYTLSALHEDMHTENLTLILQTLGYTRPKLSVVDPAFGSPPIDPAFKPHDVAVPGDTFLLGALPDEPFVFDNEKWAHPVEVKPFRISATPVTNAEFAAFVGDDGYRRRHLWDRRGWDWRRREGAEHPLFWLRGGDGRWYERRFDQVVPLEPWHPVVYVNWYEAEAYCRWAKRRLPTEAEWELAASAEPTLDGRGMTSRKRRFPWGDELPTPDRANLDFRAGGTVDVRALPAGDSALGCRQMIGNIWEWVADTFEPYPGFECDPYKEYSQPYFGQKKVLKGGCWTTRSRLIRNTWRNFFMRHRRNIFAGFRTCAI
jgi:iron(II)-dependent oxidoreductase